MKYNLLSPIPPLRLDISGFKTENKITLFDEDKLEIVEVSFDSYYWEFLQLLDGRKSVKDLCNIAELNNFDLKLNDLLDIVNRLEDASLLNSMHYLDLKKQEDLNFENLRIRPAKYAGISYPKNVDELNKTFNDFLNNSIIPTKNISKKVNAIIAPHIDFRVGGNAYGYAYNALVDCEADTFIILGTAHKLSYDKFMICSKDFETPLGVVETDKAFIESFRNNLDFELTNNEIAHKDEHSIEFEVLMLKHIFPQRNIKIIPILCGSLYEYVESGVKNIQADETFNKLYDTLTKTILELNRNVCYIASSDMSHVGLKFGDTDTANTFIDDVQKRDKEILWLLENCKTDDFINYMKATKNKYRVCGVAPIYAMLRALKPQNAEILFYDYWDEYEQGSAVSYASVAFYE